MALGTDHIINADYGDFLPEMWSDDVIAPYMSNLVIANHVSRIKHKGQRGSVIHIPKPSRGSAAAKLAETAVSFQNPASSEVQVVIDKHYVYAFLVEDLAEMQLLPSLRRHLTKDAGYALAKQVDTDLANLWEGLQGGTVGAATWANAVIGGDGSTAYDQTANTNTGNSTAITDAGIRAMIQQLDDADVPMIDRVMVVPPVAKNTLLGISRFTEQAFTGDAGAGNTIHTGLLGDIYGMKVYSSSNCPTEVAADASTKHRVGCMFHKDAFMLAEQQALRVQRQYAIEHLGTQVVADTVYGVAELRDDAGIAFVVPA